MVAVPLSELCSVRFPVTASVLFIRLARLPAAPIITSSDTFTVEPASGANSAPAPASTSRVPSERVPEFLKMNLPL